jgi:hypothetical protein
MVLTLQLVRSNGLAVKSHPRSPTEPAHYCARCQIEVFGVLFIREQENRHVVHCLDCTRRHSRELQGFICLEEYRLKELNEVYNNFKLTEPRPLTNISNHNVPQRANQPQQPAQLQPVTMKPPLAPLAASDSNLSTTFGPTLANTMIKSMSSMTPQQHQAMKQVCPPLHCIVYRTHSNPSTCRC